MSEVRKLFPTNNRALSDLAIAQMTVDLSDKFSTRWARGGDRGSLSAAIQTENDRRGGASSFVNVLGLHFLVI